MAISCSQYRNMQKIPVDENCVLKFKPDWTRVVYRTAVDVVGHHISGLLLIKSMPDSSTRIVFYNEVGFTFFDFGFGQQDSFHVYQIIPQMNKKPLIKTLRKDFDLVMFRTMHHGSAFSLADRSLVYHGYPQTKGVNYYITDSLCDHLVKMQRASNKKPVMEALFYGSVPGSEPDSISIRHLNFNFSISLKKIPAVAAQ